MPTLEQTPTTEQLAPEQEDRMAQLEAMRAKQRETLLPDPEAVKRTLEEHANEAGVVSTSASQAAHIAVRSLDEGAETITVTRGQE